MFRRDKPAPAPESLIGASVTIRGDVEFNGGVHLEGRILGNLRMAPEGGATLTLTDGAAVEGDVRAQHVSINGRVRGDVRVGGHVALGPKAVVDGNVYYGTIEMALGARINGKVLRTAAGPLPGQSLELNPTEASLQ